MFNPIKASDAIREEYIDYIGTSFHVADPDYNAQFIRALSEEGVIAKGPYLDLGDSYQPGCSIQQLMESGTLSSGFASLEDGPDEEKELSLSRRLYSHQQTAIEMILGGSNCIISSGTGSGKTECFMIPILHSLLEEQQAGTLTPGVRAILIYPMNALAGDQMLRLRRLLKSCPDITFGIYNSNTRQSESEGIREYGKIYKDTAGKPLKPLSNEMVSRERMQEAGPHILVTNYAMLEYMMLRPKDAGIFSTAKLRFLVLDEAHVYRGTTGMETALLVNRLKARLPKPEDVCHILTSATLGGPDADEEIAHFGETLCQAPFSPDHIVRSTGYTPEYVEKPRELPMSLFAKLAEPVRPLNEILEDYDLKMGKGQSDAEYLYDLVSGNTFYRNLRKICNHPMTVQEIVEAYNQHFKNQVCERDVIALIAVAVQAEKNGLALVRARYHMFARALDGAFITIGPAKKLSLVRSQKRINGVSELRVFEAAVCDSCGRIAVAGQTKDQHLEFCTPLTEKDMEYYLLRTVSESFEPDEDDEEVPKNTDPGREDYLVCSRCGAIVHESRKDHLSCDCGLKNYVPVRRARTLEVSGRGRCPACAYGTFRRVTLGYDAATAVLGTSLFEELPESEIKLKSAKMRKPKGTFKAGGKRASTETVKKTRQYLTFSDSRAEAAFFASYMTGTYEEFLRRRAVWHVLDQYKESMSSTPWDIPRFVDEVAAVLEANRTFAEPEDNGKSSLAAVSRRNAWVAVLSEMVSARRATSLASLGALEFSWKGNSMEIMEGVAEQYGIEAKDAKALFDQLVMDIVYFGAIEGDCELTEEERESVYYSIRPKRVKRMKDDKDSKKPWIAGWSAGSRPNGRRRRVERALKIGPQEANDLLRTYWDEVLTDSEDDAAIVHDGNSEFHFSAASFTIRAGSEEHPIYICNVCGRTTSSNCLDLCPTVRCPGHLVQVTRKSLLEGNHYASLYQNSQLQPLFIREHTAQLGREEQAKYQELFINKKINVLSCSTTFEMGVDVGDLETVFLRNVPPTPANYSQRAGRAGRSRGMAAFCLTYCRLSSHDFTFFNHPEDLINGKIGVPVFSLENRKILLRQVYAAALALFFSENPSVYGSNDAYTLLAGDGFERLKVWLSGYPEELRQRLNNSIPAACHVLAGVDDQSWVDTLVGPEGLLTIAVADFRQTITWYEKEIETYEKEGQLQQAARSQRRLQIVRKGPEDKAGRTELLEFLARSGILPRYGFPVDTAELLPNGASNDRRLSMTRDLQLAIADYAPDSQVVADGRLYTSRYIRRMPSTRGKDWEETWVAQCSNSFCGTWNERRLPPDSDGEICVSCMDRIPKGKWMQAIEPRRGFIAEAKTKPVPMHRPDRLYRGENCYIGDPHRKVLSKLAFSVRSGGKFMLETSASDTLMVMCSEDFYVCMKCGYAESKTDRLLADGKAFSTYLQKVEQEHHTEYGKKCSGQDLMKRKLLHTYKTDVVRISFADPRTADYSIMLSVMYALLTAMGQVLEIERSDIRGCLHKTKQGGRLIYSIILYDTASGGAGHVRRIADQSGEAFRRVVERAIDLTRNCTCEPSCYQCLRRYENARVHELLNRREAAGFLEHFNGAPKTVTMASFEKAYGAVEGGQDV